MRNLTQHEIDSLLINQCSAEDWTQILVPDDFSPNHIFSTRFSGKITLGRFDKTFEIAGGLRRHSGIRNATLHQCDIGNNVLIENVANHISNYTIGDDCYIQNVNVIAVEQRSYFGNNVYVNVLNETGGREVPIYNHLSSSLAYILSLYRHKKKLIEHLFAMIKQYAEEHASNKGTIGHHVKILNTGTIKHVNIGDCTKIVNTSRLENGSINSTMKAPVYVGDSVIATDFILSSGSYVADAAKLVRCFVGQACHVSHNFSAHDTLMFANCSFENGEACSVFAGPYTVSMHKSSLLIAGMFSFLNAGSGSNQSNHMYKLGPIHQGIVERGSKTTSDSYILWPSRIGAFSLVMGRHYRHADTTNLPFSYLIEKSDETYLIPAVNLRSVGTIRDAKKWPNRDKRTDTDLLDCINYNLLSPYTIEKMINGRKILFNLKDVSGDNTEVYALKCLKIKNSSLRNGIQLYEKAIIKFFGNSMIHRLANQKYSSIDEIRNQLQPTHHSGKGTWVDLSGLIAPKKEIERLLHQIEASSVTLKEIEQRFHQLHIDYYDMEWTWAYDAIEAYYGISLSRITIEQVREIINKWLNAVVTLDEMLYKDAMKEFSITSMIGFGVDGAEIDKLHDFEMVRGSFDEDLFVKAVRDHIATKTALAQQVLNNISAID